MTDDRTVIVCLPSAWSPWSDGGVPGSVRQWCEVCADEVWLSPDGQLVRERMPSTIVCIPCSGGVVPDDAELQVAGTDGSIRRPTASERQVIGDVQRAARRRRP